MLLTLVVIFSLVWMLVGTSYTFLAQIMGGAEAPRRLNTKKILLTVFFLYALGMAAFYILKNAFCDSIGKFYINSFKLYVF